LKLSLTDINPNPKTQKYQIFILIKPVVESVQPVPAPSQPSIVEHSNETLIKMKIETISKDALVTLKFFGKCSRDVALKIDQFQLKVIGKEELKFDWNITKRYQNRSLIDIQMYFKSDLDVSSGANIDTLEVKVAQDFTIQI
jgi:hypothetical protein